MMNSDNKTSIIANAYLDMLKDRFAPEQETPTDENNTAEIAEETPEVTEEPSTGEAEESMEEQTEDDSAVAPTEQVEEPSIFSPSELEAIKRHTEE